MGKQLTNNSGLIYPYNSENFLHYWNVWKDYRKEIRKPIKGEISEQAALMKLGRMASTEEAAIKIILQSIENGWQGLFPLKNNSNATTKEQARSAFESFYN